MFYSQFILAKKGPLGKIWLAAHLDKKLTKNQIFATDIKASVESIMAPAIPIALRLSGHLLLGVCRIYSRKVFYLYSESNDALVKTKMAFKSGAPVDLPTDQQTAQLSSITLADTSNNADLDLPPIPTQMSLDDIVANDVDGEDIETARRDSWMAPPVSFNARKADITLAEDEGGLAFGEENMELLDPNVDQGDFFVGGGEAFDIDKTMDASVDDIEVARKDEEGGPQFELEQGDAFQPSPGDAASQSFAGKSARQSDIQGVADDISIRMSDQGFGIDDLNGGDFGASDNQISFNDVSGNFQDSVSSTRRADRKKRRRVEIDKETEIKASEIKQQLANTSDIIRDFEKAPCTRKEIQDKAGGVTLDFSKPLMHAKKLAPQLMKLYTSLIPESLEKDEADAAEPQDGGGIEFADGEPSTRSSGRNKRKSEEGLDVHLGDDMGMMGEDQLSMQQEFDFDHGDLDQQQGQQSQYSVGDPELGEVAMTVGAVSQVDADESQTQGRKGKREQKQTSVDHTRSGWSKRTEKMLHVLSRQFEQVEAAADGQVDEEEGPQLEFLEMLGSDASRKTAATTFFELLVLKSTNFINVSQPDPYGEIVLTKTAEFSSQPLAVH